jgi:hypothetical protein
MRHFWVFENLLDLRDYAAANGFSKLAVKLQEAIVVAYAEIDPLDPGSAGPSDPPARRR